MVLRKYCFLLFFTLAFSAVCSSQVGIGTSTPDLSSILDVVASDSGVVLPRMTSAQRDQIANPTEALIVYNTDENCYQYYYTVRNSVNPNIIDAQGWSCFYSGVSVGNSRGSLNFNSTNLNTGTSATGFSTNASNGVNANNRKKLILPTTANDLTEFIAPSGITNRLQFTGPIARLFRVTYTISFSTNTNNLTLAFYIAKGDSGTVSGTPTAATVLQDTRVYTLTGGTAEVQTVPVVGSISLAPGEYIEVWGERFTSGGNANATFNVVVSSMNLVID